MPPRPLLAAAALAVALAAAAPAASAAGRAYKVEIRNMTFGPTPPKLRKGDTIQWVNADMFRHTATAKDRSFDVDLPPKARASTVLKVPGVIRFYCRFHPGMTGTLNVAP